MSSFDAKDLMNKFYKNGLTVGAAIALSMVLQRFKITSFGTPASVKSYLTLVTALTAGDVIIDYAELKFKFPAEPFK